MKISLVSTFVTILFVGAFAACGSRGKKAEPVIGSSASALIGTSETTIVMVKNQDLLDNLPPLVPVVLTFKGAQPSAVFRIGCGVNNGYMLEAFGYDRATDFDTLPVYDNFDLLMDYVNGTTFANGNTDAGSAPVPVQTLRCNADPNVMRSQILQVFRLTDAVTDPQPDGGSEDAAPPYPHDRYFVRFRDDPGHFYNAGCLNFLSHMNWTNWDGSNLQDVSVPITPDVYHTWKDLGLDERYIGCYTRTGWPLPDPSGSWMVPVDGPPVGSTQLWKVREKFDGISSAMTLYLITDGEGYALDCGSELDEVKTALGISPDAPIQELSVSDPRFTSSNPHAQPTLRCGRPTPSIYQTVDEDPRQSYFRVDSSSRLVHFTCDETATYFARNNDMTNPIVVTRRGLDYLLPDPNAPNATSRILKVGCVSQSNAQSIFLSMFGRYPTDDELRSARASYLEHWRQSGDSEQTNVALRWDLWPAANRELAAIIDRAIASGKSRHNNLDNGFVFPEDRDYFAGQVGGATQDAVGAGVAAYIENRIAQANPPSRASLMWMFDTIYGCDKVAPNQFGQCPAWLSWWTTQFYDPANKSQNYDDVHLQYASQQYLTSCMNNPSWNCLGEVDNVVIRACANLRNPCINDEAARKEVVDRIRANRFPMSFGVASCFITRQPNCPVVPVPAN